MLTLTLLQVVLGVVIVLGTIVFCISFYIIKKVADKPANGELSRLEKLDEAIDKHTSSIRKHLLHRGQDYGTNQHKHS